MSRERRFKYDKGDWIARRNAMGEYVLAGKVVDADSESVCVEHRGVRSVYVPGEDVIVHVRWIGKGHWTMR